jgi:hypothetical protein
MSAVRSKQFNSFDTVSKIQILQTGSGKSDGSLTFSEIEFAPMEA